MSDVAASAQTIREALEVTLHCRANHADSTPALAALLLLERAATNGEEERAADNDRLHLLAEQRESEWERAEAAEAALAKAEGALRMAQGMEAAVLCADTHRLAVFGCCPVHGGDACLYTYVQLKQSSFTYAAAGVPDRKEDEDA